MIAFLRGLPAGPFLAGIAAIAAVALLAVILIFEVALDKLRINGDRYQQIVQGKDLIADILPPPAYVIESYLMATKMVDAATAAEAQPYRDRLAKLEQDYNGRHNFWLEEELPAEIAALFNRESHDHVQTFFGAVRERLVPAVFDGRGNKGEAYDAVSAAYEAHRRVVDRIVVLAEERLASLETEAAEVQTYFGYLTHGVALVGAVALFVALGVLFVVVIRPVSTLAGAITRISEGDDSVHVDQVPGTGELARLSQATVSLKASVAEAFESRQMLDQMAANVMMARAPDMTITYANRASEALVDSLRGELPRLEGGVIGKPVDVFHKAPDRAMAVIANPDRLPFQTRIRLGAHTLQLTVSAIRDRHGAYVGPLLTWEEVTEQVRMAERFESEVAQVIENVAEAVDTIAASSQEGARRQESGSTRSMMVADAAMETKARLEGLAAAAEELTASIGEISRQVATAAEESTNAMTDVDGAAAQIGRLATAASEIGQVVNLIGEIASQTNLLALNATIEAARAGEAGKGFAVVASEVKQLATQTAKATDQITEKIGAIQDETSSAVESFDRVRRIIHSVKEISAGIAAAVEEQNAVTGEITRSVSGVSSDMARVTTSISEVTMGSIRSGAGAIDVLWSAETLRDATKMLREASDAFLSRIRA